MTQKRTKFNRYGLLALAVALAAMLTNQTPLRAATELLEPEPLPPGLRKPYVYKSLKEPVAPKPKRTQDKPNRWYEPVCEFLRNRTSATVDEIAEGLGVIGELDRIKLNNALHAMARPGGVLVKAGTRPSHKGRDYTLWKLRQENKEPTT